MFQLFHHEVWSAFVCLVAIRLAGVTIYPVTIGQDQAPENLAEMCISTILLGLVHQKVHVVTSSELQSLPIDTPVGIFGSLTLFEKYWSCFMLSA
jgi:hypothetical protein